MERGKRKWKENAGRSLAQCSKVGVSLWTVSPTDAHLVSGLISCLVLPCCTAHLLEGQKGSQGQSSLSRRVSNEIIQSTNPPHRQELLTHTAQQLDSVLLETSLAGAVTWWQEPGSGSEATYLGAVGWLAEITSSKGRTGQRAAGFPWGSPPHALRPTQNSRVDERRHLRITNRSGSQAQLCQVTPDMSLTSPLKVSIKQEDLWVPSSSKGLWASEMYLGDTYFTWLKFPT